MLSTLVLDAPAGSGGTGRVRASVRGCAAVLPKEQRLRGTGLTWGAPRGADREVPGGAMTAVAVEQPAVAAVPGAIATQPFATQPFGTTTNPYSTLGNHPPGRPRS